MRFDEVQKYNILDFQETDYYLRGEIENIFIVAWKKAPIESALDQALLPLLSSLDESSTKNASLLIVSTADENVSFNVNKHAKSIMKKYAKQVRPIAVVELSAFRPNRISLRMLLVIAGFFGIGPSISFHTDVLEACKWVSSEQKQHQRQVDEDFLLEVVQWMVSKCKLSESSQLVSSEATVRSNSSC